MNSQDERCVNFSSCVRLPKLAAETIKVVERHTGLSAWLNQQYASGITHFQKT